MKTKKGGVVENSLLPCESTPNCVSSVEAREDYFIRPFSCHQSPEIAFSNLKKVLEGQPRIQMLEVSYPYIHAEATTLVLRFVDDLEFLVDAEEDVIYLRSISRLGHSDLGKNRERLEKIRTAFTTFAK